GVVGWVRLAADHGSDHFVERRGGGQLEWRLPLRLEPVRMPDALDGHVAETHLFCQRARAPVGRSTRLRVEREVHDPVYLLLGDARLPAWPRCVLQYPIKAMDREAAPPEGHRLRARMQPLCYLMVLRSIGCHEDDL